MSIRMMSHVWEYAHAAGTQLLLMLALADYANDDGVCWPGVTRLAQRARCSERQVQRALDALVATGDIYVLARAGRPRADQKCNLYLVAAGRLEEDLARALVVHGGFTRPDAQAVAAAITARQRNARYGNGDVDVTIIPDDCLNDPAPAENEMVTPAPEMVTSTPGNGDIAMSPEPYLTTEPSLIPISQSENDGSPAREASPPDPLAAISNFIHDNWGRFRPRSRWVVRRDIVDPQIIHVQVSGGLLYDLVAGPSALPNELRVINFGCKELGSRHRFAFGMLGEATS